MTIEHIKDLIPDPNNARRHNPRNVGMLEKALNEVGAARSIVIDEYGVVLAGNATVEAAAQAGITRLHIVDEDGDTLVAVRRRGLTAEQKTKLALYDNRVAELAEWEPGVLASIAEDMDLSDLFTDLEWAEVAMPSLPEAGAGGDEFDATPEDGPTRTSLGQLWSIGGVHRLLVGDCTDAANVARLMGGERAGLCVTDPPYMVNYDPQWRVGVGGGGTQEYANGSVIANDDSLEWLGAFDNTPYDVVYIWMASTTIARLQPYLEERDFVMRYLIVWNKDLAAFGRGDYHWKHEVCLYMVRKGATGNWQGGHDQKTVWDIPTIHSFANGHSSEEWGLEGHGNQKPVECMQRPIENNSASGQLIYDPFLGSGTTLIAAHRTGRRCYGMEIAPRYADVILRRAEAEGLECTLLDG